MNPFYCSEVLATDSKVSATVVSVEVVVELHTDLVYEENTNIPA